ncbi:MAG: DUF4010 domain-containing protein [Steroidobacteraceae bacterium]
MASGNALWIGIAVACGCGLLIGLERERRRTDGSYYSFAGIRSFAVAATAGALAQALTSTALVTIGALLVAGLGVTAYLRSKARDTGITTELALFLTYLIGVTAVTHPMLASGCAALLTVLLAARSRLHRFSIEVVTETELRDGLILAAVALVILPLAPDQPLQWLGIRPRAIWIIVVLLMVVQTAGHVALRLWGARLGLALSGLASGFVTSAGTITVMGARARAQPELMGPCVAGALSSCAATFIQLALVALAANPPMLERMLPMLATALAIVGVATLPWLRRQQGGAQGPAQRPDQRMFNTPQTIGFAALLAGVTAALSWLTEHATQGVTILTDALAGFADVHAAAGAILALGREGRVMPAVALYAVLLAISTNTITKIAGSFIGGGWRFCWRVSLGLLAILGGAWGGWWVFAP